MSFGKDLSKNGLYPMHYQMVHYQKWIDLNTCFSNVFIYTSQFLCMKTKKKGCVDQVQHAVIQLKAYTGSLPTLK